MHKRLLIPATILLAVLLASLRLQNPTTPSFSQPQDVVLHIQQTGVYTLPAQVLKPFGWEFSRLEPANIQLWQGDVAIPLAVDNRGDLHFYGQVTPTRYDHHAAYVLRYGNRPAKRIGTRTAAPAQPTAQRTFQATSSSETNSTYLAQVREGDPWVGQRLSAPDEISVTLATPGSTHGPAQLDIHLWAATQSPAKIDHHLQIRLNGQTVGDESWDGNGPHHIQLALAPDLLLEQNQLILTAPGDTEAPADMVYLDKISITYPRQLQLDAGQLAFETDAPTVEIANPGDIAATIWDVTDPAAPVQLSGIEARQQYLRFGSDSAGVHRYQVFAHEQRLVPDISLAPPQLAVPAAGADYIILAHPSLLRAMQPLAAHRQQQGLRTLLVSTEQVYLKFSAGMQSPQAITDFLRWATQTWPEPAPRFILLAGDASYDPLDYLDAPNKNLVPTRFVATQVMGETASDNALTDLDDDGLPDLAIGRFPAQTAAEARAMVAKTIAYEQNRPAGPWAQHLLLVADDGSAAFSDFNSEILELIPPAFPTDNLLLSPENDIRPQLLEAFNQGRGLISYMGHGALDIWAREEIFSIKDVPKLHQQGRLPIMLVWACLNGYFQHPKRTSLGESLLLSPQGGAVAGMFPTGETYPSNQLVMARELFGNTLFHRSTLGEALLAATRQLDPTHDGQRDIILTFVLLGDPALQLPLTSTEP